MRTRRLIPILVGCTFLLVPISTRAQTAACRIEPMDLVQSHHTNPPYSTQLVWTGAGYKLGVTSRNEFEELQLDTSGRMYTGARMGSAMNLFGTAILGDEQDTVMVRGLDRVGGVSGQRIDFEVWSPVREHHCANTIELESDYILDGLKAVWNGNEHVVLTGRPLTLSPFGPRCAAGVRKNITPRELGYPTGLVWTGTNYGISLTGWPAHSTPQACLVRAGLDGHKIGSDLCLGDPAFPSDSDDLVWNGSSYAMTWTQFRSPGNNQIYFSRINAGGGVGRPIPTDSRGYSPQPPLISRMGGRRIWHPLFWH